MEEVIYKALSRTEYQSLSLASEAARRMLAKKIYHEVFGEYGTNAIEKMIMHNRSGTTQTN